MENSIVLTFALCFVALSTGSALQTRQDAGLPELEPPALEAFLVPFREAVLHRVAVAWNHTITDSAKLEVDMQTCSNQIKSTVEQCKTCAANACTKTPHVVSSSPTFTDYLLLATQLFNPEFLKGPLNEIGDKFGDIVDLLGSGSASFIDSMSSLGNDIGGAFTDVFHGLEKSFNAVKDALQKAIDGLTDVGNSIGNGLTDAGNTVIDGIGGIFGRRRRETISPELKACMTPCSTCQPLLKTNHTEMIVSVCGEQVVKFNETVRHNVISIKGIFTAVSDKTHPVITKIQIDPTSLSGVSYTRIYITGNIKGKYVRYESKVIYDMMNLGSTANNIAEEFWKLWM